MPTALELAAKVKDLVFDRSAPTESEQLTAAYHIIALESIRKNRCKK
jgi:hypothetical protein